MTSFALVPDRFENIPVAQFRYNRIIDFLKLLMYSHQS